MSEETFRIVGDEMQRRSDSDGRAHGVSVFSGRIVCEECGGFYGRKVWHPGSDYASFRWHCNNRFAKKTGCNTPTVKQEDLEAAFIRMFNGLHARRAEIEENWRVCLAAVTDTSGYEAELEQVETACAGLQALMKSALLERGQNLDADDATSRYEAYQERLLEQARIKEELEGKIAVLTSKRIQAERFLGELAGHDGPMTEFDPMAWQAVVHHASMSADGTLTFFLRDGTQEKTKVESSVRQYRKRSAQAEGARV